MLWHKRHQVHVFAEQTQHGSIQLLVLLMWDDGSLRLPLPVFVVETAEVIQLGDFFEVLGQFIQLPVFLSVQVGLHEWSDLIAYKKTKKTTSRYNRK